MFSIPPKTKSRSSFSFSTVMSSGSLMKDDICLCGVLHLSPMLRRKSPNCEDSPRSFAIMFCVSCNLVTIFQRYKDFSVASTISGLVPFRTTGKICRQSPTKRTASPPNGDDFFRMSCIFLSIDLNTCLCPIENSRNLRIRPIRGGHEKPSFRLGGGGGRLQNAPSANAFL